MRLNRKGSDDKIFFWERLAFRISAGFILPVVVSAYALFSVSTLFTEVSETKERMQRTWNGIHLSESKAILTLTKMRMHAQAYQYEASQDLARLLEGEAKEFTLDMSNSRRSLDVLASSSGTALDTSIKKAYDDITKKYAEFEQTVGRMIDASRRQSPTDAAAARQDLDRVAKDTETMIARLHAQLDNFEGTLTNRIAVEEERSNRTLVFYLVAVLMFGIGAAIIVTFSITSPVNKVVARIRDIATGEGDLTKRVTTRAGGELSELATWLNLFLDKTHGIIATIAHASSTVGGTTSQVGKIAESMTVAAAGINRNMMEQSMNIDECTMRVGSIDDLIQNAGESTRQAASLSKIAMDRALQGGASVHETIEAMEKIEDSARKVEELVSSINEIASQTNLLAINAAIEATKAGEHGKGFAVVAEEVRKLAERARKLTAEVTSLIGESSGRVKAGVGLARAAGISLDGIIKDVEAVVSLIQRIASASAKQTESSTVALEFMQKVAEGVRATLSEMEGVTKSTEMTANEVLRLNALVSQLNEVVGSFRLNHEQMPFQPGIVEAPEGADDYSDPSEAPTGSTEVPPSERPTLAMEVTPEDLAVNPNVPGELSFEAMMNPVPRGAPPVLPSEAPAGHSPADALLQAHAAETPPPAPPARTTPPPGLPPLPPGADPGAGGEEDAA